MKSFTLAAAAALVFAAQQLTAQLMITGVFDGPLPNGTPKGVELYAEADVPDLSRYGLGSVSDATGSRGVEFVLAGSILAGEYLHIGNTRNKPAFEQFFGVRPDTQHFDMTINGDDAIELFRDSVVVDRFGSLGEAGVPSAWCYRDGWAYRSGPGPSATFDPADWRLGNKGAFTGCATNADCPGAMPFEAYAEPLPIRIVSFTAEAAPPRDVELAWEAALGPEFARMYLEASATTADDGAFVQVASFGEGDGARAGGGTRFAYTYHAPRLGTYYFRLRQLDRDGSSTYSDTATATLREAPDGPPALQVGGAAVDGMLSVRVDGSATVRVYDLIGRRCVGPVEIAGAGELDVSGLASGAYVVSDGATARRFTVVR